MTTATTIAATILRDFAGVYYVIPDESHVMRQRCIDNAAKAIEPALTEFAEDIKRQLATNPT